MEREEKATEQAEAKVNQVEMEPSKDPFETVYATVNEEDEIEQEDFFNEDDLWENEEKEENGSTGFARELLTNFPGLFANDFREVEIPTGWREFTIKSLRMFEATDLPIAITYLSIEAGDLVADVEDQNSSGHIVLNRLLKPASKLCMICGEIIAWDQKDDNLKPALPICENCQQKFARSTEDEKVMKN